MVPIASPRDGSTVLVFARAPAQETKALGRRSDRTERLHRLLLERTLRTAASVPGTQVRLVTTGDLGAAEQLAREAVPGQAVEVRLQSGTGATRRLEQAVREAFDDGARRLVVIGADSPELQADHLEAALSSLAGDAGDARAAIGPARDGGYYLLALSRFTRAPFEGMRFGGAGVLADTVSALDADGFALTTLEPLDDLDSSADLDALVRRLRQQARPADAPLLAAALAVLADRELSRLPPGPLPLAVDGVRLLVARGPPAGIAP